MMANKIAPNLKREAGDSSPGSDMTLKYGMMYWKKQKTVQH